MLDVIKHRNKTISKATVCKRGITEEISIQCAEYRVENGKRESKGVREAMIDRVEEGNKSWRDAPRGRHSHGESRGNAVQSQGRVLGNGRDP